MSAERATTVPQPNPLLRIAAAGALSLFLLGFVVPALGAWIEPIMLTWLIGTQRPWRGFLLVTAIALLPNLIADWRQGFAYAGWMLTASLLTVLPYLFHRLISPRLTGIASTLPLPLWGTFAHVATSFLIPADVFRIYDLAQTQDQTPLRYMAADLGFAVIVFLMLWCAAVVNWMWDHDFRPAKVATGGAFFGALFIAAWVYGLLRQFGGDTGAWNVVADVPVALAALVGGAGLSAWAISRPDRQRIIWANRPEIVALLRSPFTGEPLQVVRANGGEALVSASGERFPIRDGIPSFVKPEDVTGSNQKYNQLYEMIGGFYDSSQRFVGALLYGGTDHIFLSYLRFLEIKPGDRVLETSVGTGLNFKYLPRNVELFGLDLSREMLRNCQMNLWRWDMNAYLIHGNAERLPFADESFDVVYHAGGINFFNNKERAIREMIRVAKPGSRILIADETEQHVKGAYEQNPVISGYFRDRNITVAAPVDLVPPEMRDIHVEIVWDGRFYALTFRKPDRQSG